MASQEQSSSSLLDLHRERQRLVEEVRGIDERFDLPPFPGLWGQAIQNERIQSVLIEIASESWTERAPESVVAANEDDPEVAAQLEYIRSKDDQRTEYSRELGELLRGFAEPPPQVELAGDVVQFVRAVNQDKSIRRRLVDAAVTTTVPRGVSERVQSRLRRIAQLERDIAELEITLVTETLEVAGGADQTAVVEIGMTDPHLHDDEADWVFDQDRDPDAVFFDALDLDDEYVDTTPRRGAHHTDAHHETAEIDDRIEAIFHGAFGSIHADEFGTDLLPVLGQLVAAADMLGVPPNTPLADYSAPDYPQDAEIASTYQAHVCDSLLRHEFERRVHHYDDIAALALLERLAAYPPNAQLKQFEQERIEARGGSIAEPIFGDHDEMVDAASRVLVPEEALAEDTEATDAVQAIDRRENRYVATRPEASVYRALVLEIAELRTGLIPGDPLVNDPHRRIAVMDLAEAMYSHRQSLNVETIFHATRANPTASLTLGYVAVPDTVEAVVDAIDKSTRGTGHNGPSKGMAD